MSNNANMISIGFDNYVNFDRVIAVLAAGDPQAKKALCRRKRRTKTFGRIDGAQGQDGHNT